MRVRQTTPYSSAVVKNSLKSVVAMQGIITSYHRKALHPSVSSKQGCVTNAALSAVGQPHIRTISALWQDAERAGLASLQLQMLADLGAAAAV